MREELILTAETIKEYIGGRIEIKHPNEQRMSYRGKIEAININKSEMVVKYIPSEIESCQDYVVDLENDGLAKICGDRICSHSFSTGKTVLLFPNKSEK